MTAHFRSVIFIRAILPLSFPWIGEPVSTPPSMGSRPRFHGGRLFAGMTVLQGSAYLNWNE